ncbi:hypothetical protein AGMMS49525_15870 [Bacteroidia bacterium]|nr:hypothetical protein AGMMS49525_15870 [Bacteroidia bacterium]
MQAYKFDTEVHEGIIRIPEQYLKVCLSPSVRVIILPKPLYSKDTGGKKKFTAMGLKTKKLKFTREEANAR